MVLRHAAACCSMLRPLVPSGRSWGPRFKTFVTYGFDNYCLPGLGGCNGISRQSVVPSNDASKQNTGELLH